MSDWTPTVAPHLWFDDELGRARYFRDAFAEEEYCLGKCKPQDTAIVLSSGASAGATSLSFAFRNMVSGQAATLSDPIPSGTVLYFSPGMGKAARTSSETAVDATTIDVETLPQALSSGDAAPYPPQTEVQIDSPMEVAGGIGGGIYPDAVPVDLELSGSDTSAQIQTAARRATSVADDQHCDWDMLIALPDATEEILCRLRWVRTSATESALYLYMAESGSLHALPDMVFSGNTLIGMGSGMVAPAYMVDVAGKINADSGLVGADLWAENPSGTLLFTDPQYVDVLGRGEVTAEITGQIQPTQVSPDPPVELDANAPMTANLNVAKVAGATWAAAPDEDSGTATYAASATDYTIATKTPTDPGLYLAVGRVDVTPVSGDLGKNFWCFLTDGTDSSPLPKVRPKIAGQVEPISVYWLVELDGATAVTLKTRKDAGAGTTSTAAGSLDLWRYGKV